jgi:hypothetical protein
MVLLLFSLNCFAYEEINECGQTIEEYRDYKGVCAEIVGDVVYKVYATGNRFEIFEVMNETAEEFLKLWEIDQ